MVSASGIMAPLILVLTAATFWAYHNVELEKRSLEELDLLKKQEDAMALLEKRPLSWIQKAFKCVSCEEPYQKQKEEESALLLQRQENYKQALDALEQHRYRGKIAGIVGIVLLLTSFLFAFRNKLLWIPDAISSFCLWVVFHVIDKPWSIFSFIFCFCTEAVFTLCARAFKESSSLKHSPESFIQRVVQGSNNKDPLDKDGTETPLTQPEQDTSEASSSNTPEMDKASETSSSHTPAMPGSSSDPMVFDGRVAKEEAERLAKEEVDRVVKEQMAVAS